MPISELSVRKDTFIRAILRAVRCLSSLTHVHTGVVLRRSVQQLVKHTW
jgi:hypothetical protein